MDNQIIMFEKEEAEDIFGDELTDEQWLEIKVKIAQNKNLWGMLDDALFDAVQEIR